MAEWRIEYEEPDAQTKTAHVSLPDEKYRTAQAVQVAVRTGKIEGIKVRTDSIVLVQKHPLR